MSLSGFLQGFHQTFGQTGGYQGLGTELNKRYGDYSPYQDPEFLQQYETAKQMGTSDAMEEVADQYGDYLDVPDDQTAQEYLFEPAEGTPQSMEQRANEMKLEGTELGLDRDRLQYDLEKEYAPQQYQTELEQAQTAAERENFQLGLDKKYKEDQIKTDLERADLANDMNKFEYNQMQERAPEELKLLEQKVESGEISNDAAREELENLKLKVGLNEKYLPGQYEHQETMQGYEAQSAEQGLQKGAEELTRLQTGNEYYEEELLNQLEGQELQNINARINNEIARQERDQQRELFPLEKERIKNQIYGTELQNRGNELDLDFQESVLPLRKEQMRYETDNMGLQRDLTQEELEQTPLDQMDPLQLAQLAVQGDSEELWEQTPFADYMTADEFSEAFMQSAEGTTGTAGPFGEDTDETGAGTDLSDLAGKTPEGQPVYGTVRGGFYTFDDSGQPNVYTGEIETVEDEEDEFTVDLGRILYESPLVPAERAERYIGEQVPLPEANRMIQAQSIPFDQWGAISPEQMENLINPPDKTYEEFKKDVESRNNNENNNGNGNNVDEIINESQNRRNNESEESQDNSGFWNSISNIAGQAGSTLTGISDSLQIPGMLGGSDNAIISDDISELSTETEETEENIEDEFVTSGSQSDDPVLDIALIMLENNPDKEPGEIAQTLTPDKQRSQIISDETGVPAAEIISMLHNLQSRGIKTPEEAKEELGL